MENHREPVSKENLCSRLSNFQSEKKEIDSFKINKKHRAKFMVEKYVGKTRRDFTVSLVDEAQG